VFLENYLPQTFRFFENQAPFPRDQAVSYNSSMLCPPTARMRQGGKFTATMSIFSREDSISCKRQKAVL
jgi:hypothetical protein